MKIIIETIPHKEQRYNTCGDWQWEDDDTLHIKVSKMKTINDPMHLCPDDFMEFVVGIHEAIEAMVCVKTGVTEKDVDDFDNDKKMQKEIEKLDIESGDHPKAPYKQQHSLAIGIERILCFALGVPWFEYENQLIEMTEEYDE